MNTRDVDRARRLAYDRSLAPDDAMRRIRNAIGEHDGVFADPDDDEFIRAWTHHRLVLRRHQRPMMVDH